MTGDDQAKSEPSHVERRVVNPTVPQVGRTQPEIGDSAGVSHTLMPGRTPREPVDIVNFDGPANKKSSVGGGTKRDPADPGWVIETVVSPFHCLYQDALYFHTRCRLARGEGEASRLARAAFLLYVSSAEALVHQAAEELGSAELRSVLADPRRPLPLFEAWCLLPAIVAEPSAAPRPFDPEVPPWPQFAELLTLRDLWTYPGLPARRRAFYGSARRDGDYEPLEPHRLPACLRRPSPPECLALPRTGIPCDPYAFHPRHLDTARGVLDAAIGALDRRMGGALTRNQRHRREPVRVVYPPSDVRGA